MKPWIAGVCLTVALSAAPAYADLLVRRDGLVIDVGGLYHYDGTTIEYLSPSGEVLRVAVTELDLARSAALNGLTSGQLLERAVSTPPLAALDLGAGDAVAILTDAELEPFRREREALAETHPPVPSAEREQLTTATSSGRSEAARLEQWRSEARRLRDRIDAIEAEMAYIEDELVARDENPLDYRLSYEYNHGVARYDAYYRRGAYSYYGGPRRADAEYYALSERLLDLRGRYEAEQRVWSNFLDRARRAGVPPGYLRD
jgi:hypothetical protein